MVTSVTGVHESGKSNMDVLHFDSQNKIFNYFPQNLNNFFGNINHILIYSANISTLTKKDLQQFGSKLQKFWFYKNQLEVLEADLFEDTPNIEWIYLDENKLKFVERGTFVKLQKLSQFYCRKNPCHNGGASTRSSVISLTEQIENNCQDKQVYERYNNQNSVTTTTTTTEKIKSVDELKIEELTAQIDALKQQHQTEIIKLNAEKEKLKVNYQAEVDNLKKELNNIKNCDARNDEIMQKLNKMDAKIDAKLDSTKDSMAENFISINATCFALQHKIEVLSVRPFRQP